MTDLQDKPEVKARKKNLLVRYLTFDRMGYFLISGVLLFVTGLGIHYYTRFYVDDTYLQTALDNLGLMLSATGFITAFPFLLLGRWTTDSFSASEQKKYFLGLTGAIWFVLFIICNPVVLIYDSVRDVNAVVSDNLHVATGMMLSRDAIEDLDVTPTYGDSKLTYTLRNSKVMSFFDKYGVTNKNDDGMYVQRFVLDNVNADDFKLKVPMDKYNAVLLPNKRYEVTALPYSKTVLDFHEVFVVEH